MEQEFLLEKTTLTLIRIIHTYDKNNPYLSTLWSHTVKFLGTLFFVHDGSKNDVRIEKLEIEPDNEPLKSINLAATAVDLSSCSTLTENYDGHIVVMLF